MQLQTIILLRYKCLDNYCLSVSFLTLHVSVVPPLTRALLFAPRHCGVVVPAEHAFFVLPHTQVPPSHLLYNNEPVQSESFAHLN